jgi:hypothetical protein
MLLVLAGLPLSAAAQTRTTSSSDTRSASTTADQQNNVPADVRQAEDTIESTARRFGGGVEGGVGLDPESILFGAHGAFGPMFKRGVEFRPGFEIGIGEVTTLFGINLDVLYTLPGTSRAAAWRPYIGAGPNFALSHRGFEVAGSDLDKVDGVAATVDNHNRFDFSDTDFEGGFNFIAGARRRNGMFLEMKATAYGVSNVRLMLGFNF